MNEVELKQQELKKWIKKLFKSQKDFAQQYYMETYVNYDDEDLERFYEAFKGHLKRKTTDIGVISKYLKFLFDSQEFRDSESIKPEFYFLNELSNDFNLRMKKISKKITDHLIESNAKNIS
ncbi:hypothetical protein [Sulfuricurvum sp.]|uniref:hypothetical protein n=1 Tax=Sulfuricurvum sp. TaxID=2025608 RepID=UPI00260A92D1|nr:hypothetical protein [Sulfuricurvum sp.]MDD2782302.1 hypothetical protein [Sulfuricurvum sp.]